MKLTILGCGTSTGVPVAGCLCDICTSPFPRNKRTRTSALITLDSGRSILIDASTDLRAQALRESVRDIRAVLYTHMHSDHILGTDDLRAFNFVHQERIGCYGEAATLGHLQTVFEYIFHPDLDHEGGQVAQLDPIEIVPGVAISVQGVSIMPFRLWHGRLAVLGYRIGELAYATDCNRIPEESFELLRGVRYLILDGLRVEPHRTHFHFAAAIEAARSLAVERTWFVHMTHTVDYEKTNAELPPGFGLAHDGMQLDFAGT